MKKKNRKLVRNIILIIILVLLVISIGIIIFNIFKPKTILFSPPTYPTGFIPILGYTHNFNGGRDVLWNANGQYTAWDGKNWTPIITPVATSGFPNGFIPIIGYSYNFNGIARDVLWNANGQFIIYNGTKWTTPITAVNLPVGFKPIVARSSKIGNTITLWDSSGRCFTKTENTSWTEITSGVKRNFPLLPTSAPKFSYYFNQTGAEFNYFLYSNNGKIDVWRYIKSTNSVENITDYLQGLPNGIPNLAYSSIDGKTVYLWYGDDEYISKNGLYFKKIDALCDQLCQNQLSSAFGEANSEGILKIQKSTFLSTTSCNSRTLGDIDGDGKVNAVDVQIEINVLLGVSNSSQYPCADTNKDGMNNAVDLQVVINQALGEKVLTVSPQQAVKGSLITFNYNDYQIHGNLTAVVCNFNTYQCYDNVTFYDDGFHNDGIAGDKIYGTVWSAFGKDEGLYALEIESGDYPVVFFNILPDTNPPQIQTISTNFRTAGGKYYLDIAAKVTDDSRVGKVSASIFPYLNLTSSSLELTDSKIINGTVESDGVYEGTVEIPAGNNLYQIMIYAGDIYSNWNTKPVNATFEQVFLSQKCKPLYDNQNVLDADRINLVFVGADYPSMNDFLIRAKRAADLDNNFAGIFSLDPMKSNKNKVNIWYVDQLATTRITQDKISSCGNYFNAGPYAPLVSTFNPDNSRDYCLDQIIELSSLCHVPIKGSQVIYMVGRDFRSFAYIPSDNLNSKMVVSYPIVLVKPTDILLLGLPEFIFGETFLTNTFSHEFGHSFGQLFDEYVENSSQGTTSMSNSDINYTDGQNKNCYISSSKDTCIQNAPWKSMVGNGCGVNGVIDCNASNDFNAYNEIGCSQGCNYYNKVTCTDCSVNDQFLYRPNEINIMGWGDGKGAANSDVEVLIILILKNLHYNEWDKKLIQDNLNKFTGMPLPQNGIYYNIKNQTSNYALSSFQDKVVSIQCNGANALLGCNCDSNKLLGTLLTSFQANTCICTYNVGLISCSTGNCPTISATAKCNSNQNIDLTKSLKPLQKVY